MASRRGLAAIVACALILAACTGATVDTDPTAPPGVFAPTPSIGDESAPTTTARPEPSTAIYVERTVIYPVDPLTLEALPGFSPIPMGDWTWGVSSPNGRWLALIFGDETGSRSGVRLVDVPAWEMVGEWSNLSGSAITVTDEGAIHAVTYSAPRPELIRVVVGSDEPEILAELSPGFSPWLPRFENEQILLVGQIFDSTSAQSEVELVTVDTTTGEVVQTPIPEVTMGPTELIEFGDGQTGVIDSVPALVWDEGNGRLSIVHATEDVVTELDTISGGVTKHRFGSGTDEPIAAQITQDQLNNAAFWASTHRSAALSHDGAVMYVASLIGDFIEEDDGPVSITRSSGILAIDTGGWEIIDRLDAPISHVFMSPDGQRLIATGYTQENGEGGNGSESSGLYVIDPVDLEVIVHHPPGVAEQYLGQVSYSGEGSLAYVSSYANEEIVDVIDLETGAIVNNRAGVQVFGEVAIVADPGSE